jgi:hypothetical protein
VEESSVTRGWKLLPAAYALVLLLASVARTWYAFVAPIVSDSPRAVVVGVDRLTFVHAPPFTDRWSWYEATPFGSQADHHVQMGIVVLPSVVVK